MKKTLMFTGLASVLLLGWWGFSNFPVKSVINVDTSFFLNEIRNVKKLNLFSFQEKYLLDKDGNIIYGSAEVNENPKLIKENLEENFNIEKIKSDISKIQSSKNNNDIKRKTKDLDKDIKTYTKFENDIQKLKRQNQRLTLADRREGKVDSNTEKLNDLNSKQSNLKQIIINKYLDLHPEIVSVKLDNSKSNVEKIVLVEYFVGLDMSKIEIDTMQGNITIQVPEVEILNDSKKVIDYLVEKKITKSTKINDEQLNKLIKSKKINDQYFKIGNDIALDYVKKLYPALKKDSVNFIQKNKI